MEKVASKKDKIIIEGREYKKGPGIQMMEETEESLKGRTIVDIPHPPPIKTVVQTVTDISDVPGQMKVDKSGKLLGKFLYFDGLTYPIIDCYDNWLHNRLHQQILSTRPFEFPHGTVRFTDITITPPTEKSGNNETYNIYPRDCRTNSMTYSASVYARFEYTPKDTTKDKLKSTPFLIGKIPLMLGSQLCHLSKLTEKEMIAAGECNHDPFGYFIIKGVDEIIILKERLRCNVPLIFVNDENKSEIDKTKGTKREISTICQFTAFTLMGTTITNIVYDTYTKSLQLELGLFGKSPNTSVSAFSTKLSGFNALLPFRLFGVTDNNKIKEMILRYVKKGENKVQIAGFLQSTLNSLNKLVELDELARIIPIWKDMYGPKGKNQKASDQEKLDFGVQEIEDNLFKQMSGVPNVRMAKLELLAIMIARYSEQRLNLRPTDDRDNWANKRIISAGLAMEQLFNKVWQKLVIRGMEKSIEEQKQNLNDKSSFVLSDLVSIFEKHGNAITNTFVTSFTPDQWGIKGDKLKGNMTDYLKNDTLLSKYSQILRVKAEMNENNNQIQPRLLHMSQCGLICPGATPEGKQCGIVKECAIGMYTSIYRNDQPLLQLVKKYLSVNYVAETHYAAFMLNGKFYGWCDGVALRDKIRGYRRSLKVDRDTAIRFEEPAILWVFTDGGRPTQPLLIVDKERQKLLIQEDDMWDADFKTLLEKGYIEYLDPFETEETYKSDFLLAKSVDEIAFGVESNYQLISSYKVISPSTGPSQTSSLTQRDLQRPYTHCLMDPSAVFSVLASIIPFANRNQAPRITLQCSMGKQALGISHTNLRNRTDLLVQSLAYPTQPAVMTQIYPEIGLTDLPAGQMVTIAYCPFYGYNQEDAIVVSKSAVERGLFRSFRTITIKVYESRGSTKEPGEQIEAPSQELINKNKGLYDYSMLDANGIIKVNSPVVPRTCIVSKVKIRKGPNGVEEKIDASEYLKLGDTGIVENVFISELGGTEIKKIVIIKIREMRIPQSGDKLACYTKDTDVLTTDGWISVKDLTMQHKVATNVKGHVVYEHPTALQSYDYEGEMYQLKSNQVDLLVTPNHNLYVQKRDSNEYILQRADETFGKRVKHQKNGINNLSDKDFFYLPACTYTYKGKTINAQQKSIPMNSFLKLFGIWMAEGCSHLKAVKICGHKQRVKDVLDEIESDLGIKYSRTDDLIEDNKDIYYILDRQYCAFFTTLSVGAINKSLPSWCFELSQTQSQILLHSMVLGDGTFMKSGAVKYYTSSSKLADDVQRLALHSGWSANSKIRFSKGHQTKFKDRIITSTADAYDISIIFSKNTPQVNHGHTKSQNGQSEAWVPFSGKVYCCTVPSGVIYIRYNGKPVWCGNSRYAQKGTIGKVVPTVDLPFIYGSGQTPDLFLNMHAIPSRMTMGKILEILASSSSVLAGKRINSTAFRPLNTNDFRDVLKAYGFNPNGYSMMVNGITGELMQTPIFTGPCYFQVLRHQVRDKYQGRATGPKNIKTRQPIGKKKNSGAIKLEEMAEQAIGSHGAAYVLKNKFEHSDLYKTIICNKCQYFTNFNIQAVDQACKRCKTKDYRVVTLPYILKYKMQLLAANGIMVKLKTKDINKENTNFLIPPPIDYSKAPSSKTISKLSSKSSSEGKQEVLEEGEEVKVSKKKSSLRK